MSNTVTIRPSNWTIAPQGAATPQANLPGSYSMEAARSGVYGHLADSLGRLAGIEVRQRDARRADALSAAKVGFLKETMEFENGLENDMDFETHRERMKAFQDETYRKYAAMLGDDESRNALKVETTLPALRQEFEVGHRSAGRLNDRMVADFSQRTDDLLSQSGFNPQRDADALQIVRADVERLYNSGAISAMQKEKYLSDAEKTVRLNRWSVLTETDPQTVLSAFSSSLGGSVAHEVRDVVPQGYHNKIEAKVREEIVKAAQEMGVDPNLALAVAWQESGGKQGAVSGKGARGIFQLMPGTAQEMGVNPDDWRGNIRGGVGYLAKQLKAHGGDVPLALAAYNAGPGNVQKYGGVPPFKETMKYVPAVMARAGYEAPAVAGGGAGGELAHEDMGGLSTQEFFTFYNKAEAKVRQMEAQRNGLISAEKRNVADHMEYALMTGDFGPVKETEARLAALGDNETASALSEQRNIYEQIQPTLQGYSSEPLLAQAQAADELLMTHLRPDNARMVNDMRQNLHNSMDKRIKEFKADPAAFAAQSAYVNAPDISGEERAIRSLETQMRLGAGLEGFQPQVLGKQKALDIKNTYDKSPITDKYDLVRQLHADYGRFFTEVSEEAGLPAAATLLSGAFSNLPQVTAEKLLTASSLASGDIPSMGNEKSKADAQARVANSRLMQVLQGTVGLLSGNEEQVRGVSGFEDAMVKATLLGMDPGEIDREYNTVNDSGFLLAVPKAQGDIKEIISALGHKRRDVAQGMTGDAAKYIDVLAARERIQDTNTTIWTMRGNDFVLIDKETQSIALDSAGQPIVVSQDEIPGLNAYTKEIHAVTQEKAEVYLGGVSF